MRPREGSAPRVHRARYTQSTPTIRPEEDHLMPTPRRPSVRSRQPSAPLTPETKTVACSTLGVTGNKRSNVPYAFLHR